MEPSTLSTGRHAHLTPHPGRQCCEPRLIKSNQGKIIPSDSQVHAPQPPGTRGNLTWRRTKKTLLRNTLHTVVRCLPIMVFYSVKITLDDGCARIKGRSPELRASGVSMLLWKMNLGYQVYLRYSHEISRSSGIGVCIWDIRLGHPSWMLTSQMNVLTSNECVHLPDEYVHPG